MAIFTLKAVVEVMDMITTMAVDAVAVQVKKKQAAVVVVQTTIMDITMKSMKPVTHLKQVVTAMAAVVAAARYRLMPKMS